MPSLPSTAVDPDPELARRRFRRVIVQIFAVQIATLLGLWLLNVAFGVS